MDNKIADTTRRTRGYRFIDGLFETGDGILFMLLSVPYLLWSLAPQGSNLASLASIGRDVVLLLGIALLLGVVWAIKQRSTYARTGYVKERRPERRQVLKTLIIGVGAMLIFAGLMVAGILFFPVFRVALFYCLGYAPSFLGLFFAFGCFGMGFRYGIRRFYGLAGVACLASLGLVVFSRLYLVAHPFDWAAIASNAPINGPIPAGLGAVLVGLFHNIYTGAAIFLAVFGLAMLVSGLVTRRKYLRENPFPQETANEQ